MIAAAKLAMNLSLPFDVEGKNEILDPEKCEHWMRRLYEKAIGNFYRFHLNPNNWKVITGKSINWKINNATDGIKEILPSMKTILFWIIKINLRGSLLIQNSLVYFIKVVGIERSHLNLDTYINFMPT